ncbi:MAG: ATP-binding protein [Thermodesulfobacteriota bacterium]
MPSTPSRAAPGRKSLATLRNIVSLASAPAEQSEILVRGLELVVRGLGYDGAVLHLLGPNGGLETAARAGARPEPGGTAGSVDSVVLRAAHGDRLLVWAQGRSWTEEELRSQGLPPGPGGLRVLAPLSAPDRALGVLEGYRARGGRGGLGDAMAALAVAAGHFALVLRNRELLEGNLAKIQQLLALQRVSRQMTAGGELGDLLRMVVEEAMHLTGAQGGTLYLIDREDEGQLALQAWSGEAPAPGRERIPLGYGIAGWVARGGRALRVSDRSAGREAGAYASRRSQLAVPLVSEARVLGVLAVEGRGELGFTPTHEEILGLFAAQAAKAIEARRFLQEIRDERDLRDQILDGTPNGVVALDRGRHVTLMNRAARRFLGVAEAPEGNPLERYLNVPAVHEEVSRVLADEGSGESIEVAAPGHAAGGEEGRYLRVSAFPLANRPGATLILQDLTDRRRLNERVQRMSRLASIGQLAAGIAHEIRNPLTGVAISLDILREEAGLSPEGRALLEDINREIDRLETLIRGLLDFARPQPPAFRPMRVAKALEWHRTFGEQCRKKGVDFRLELRDNPKLQGDPEKLKQLFLNLAINALEAVPAGGEIRVWAEALPGKAHPWVRVGVEDTGPGMDEETAAQAFNPFFTTKNEGTGLGLSIAHSIAEQHGGRIDLQSRPGRGARFTVDLPALPAPEEA